MVRARPEPAFEITVDGAAVPVVPGQSIGAALYGAGVRSWRTTRHGGRPRGLFCGIGVCFDCLVTVNGVPSLRACQIEARAGDRVTTGDDDTAGGAGAVGADGGGGGGVGADGGGDGGGGDGGGGEREDRR
nr:(2Fe-2S)-binding protein [Planomonospora venezuelensis]